MFSFEKDLDVQLSHPSITEFDQQFPELEDIDALYTDFGFDEEISRIALNKFEQFAHSNKNSDNGGN